MSSDQPLWPQPVEIVGLTGEYATGKTMFACTVAPGPATRVYDFEKSSAPYVSLGFDRVDVPKSLLAKYPHGYKPIDVFNWWLADVRAIAPGRFRVIVVDPATDLERGLVDWVAANPSFFGHTAGQYQSMSGIMWGDVKDYWKLILTDLAARCETFVFTAHLGAEFADKKPTGKLKPKGKDTLPELASLYLWMEWQKDKAGGRAAKPSAKVIKSRLSFTRVDPATGDVDIRPALPPRLPVATPHAVRQYLLAPPDYANLSDAEKAPEAELSADERLRLEVARAEAERDAAFARLEADGRAAEAAKDIADRDQFVREIAAAADKPALDAVQQRIRDRKLPDAVKPPLVAAFKSKLLEIERQAATANGQPAPAA